MLLKGQVTCLTKFAKIAESEMTKSKIIFEFY